MSDRGIIGEDEIIREDGIKSKYAIIIAAVTAKTVKNTGENIDPKTTYSNSNPT